MNSQSYFPSSDNEEPVEIPGEVVIQKTDENELGIGAYGAVYRAKIGHLPCAAKIIHPTLFHTSDPGSDRIKSLFDRECRVLRRIRHPHVIQYIKSFQDHDTRLPVLLMELMDESLTHYLESLSSPVPHHVKLNIAHDIALALDFLHGIGVLHRDLSGNNVLLIAGKRAKVTDFGMAKVWDSGNTQMTPATFCPGTMAYMPPEAFKAEPIYTEKLDIFSVGVVYLQILTREFPKPKDRVRHVNDERYPTGIEVIIPERDRREAEIALAAPDDPLLHIALDCMHDKAFMRPHASEVCERIETLKSTSWTEYVNRQERLEREGLVGGGEEGERENGIDAFHLKEVEMERDEARAQLVISQSRMSDLTSQLEEKEKEVEELKSKLMTMEKEHREKMEALMRSLREKHEMLTMQGNHYEQSNVEEEVATRDARITELERQLRSYKEDTRRREQLSLPLSAMPTRTLSASDVSSIPQDSRSPPSPQLLEMKWRLRGTARRIEGNSSALTDSFIYFTDGMLVLMFNRATGDWTTLPPCPKHSFSITVIGGLPTAVGGFTEAGNSSSLLSLSGEGHPRVWLKTYPAMKYGRTCPATVAAGEMLVVAGGHGTDEIGRYVEVLNMTTMVWSLTAPLPFPLWRASAVTCRGRLYLGGGEKKGKPLGSADVLHCSLSELQTLSHQKQPHPLPSSHKRLLPFKFSGGAPKVWHSATKLPVVKSTLVSCQGRLFAVGGQNRGTNTPTADVYCFSPASNEWKRCSQMNVPRSRCFAVALDDSQLLALGGSVEPFTLTDSIEIALLTSK